MMPERRARRWADRATVAAVLGAAAGIAQLSPVVAICWAAVCFYTMRHA